VFFLGLVKLKLSGSCGIPSVDFVLRGLLRIPIISCGVLILYLRSSKPILGGENRNGSGRFFFLMRGGSRGGLRREDPRYGGK